MPDTAVKRTFADPSMIRGSHEGSPDSPVPSKEQIARQTDAGRVHNLGLVWGRGSTLYRAVGVLPGPRFTHSFR
jgi:hypothetical protein